MTDLPNQPDPHLVGYGPGGLGDSPGAVGEWRCSCGHWNGLWPWCGSCSLFRWNQPQPVVYTAKVYRHEPETRWFHRNVLRRRVRLVLLHAGVCDGFTLEQNLNRVSNATIVLRDPAEDIAHVRGVIIESDACPSCGVIGGRYVSHVCLTAGIPSHVPEPRHDPGMVG